MAKPTRFSLALDFACAAMAVLLSGHVADEMLRRTEREAVPQPQPIHSPYVGAFAGVDPREFQQHGKYRGLIDRAAAIAGVSRFTVREVLHGRGTSLRISDFLSEEKRRVDAQPSMPEPLPLTHAEQSDFGRGRKYYGVYTRVAEHLGVDRGGVFKIGTGRSKSRRVLAAIRAEMARVDAELAAREVSE